MCFMNGDRQYIGAGDLGINRLMNETSSTFSHVPTAFPLRVN